MNEPDRKFCLAFSVIPEIGPARFRKIKNFFGTFENAWHAKLDDFAKGVGFGENIAKKIYQAKIDVLPEKELAVLSDFDIQFITAEDKEYPLRLSEVSSAPYILFFKGEISLLSTKQIGVVGSRLPSQYGKTATEKIVSDLSRAGLTITSGMAHGIDSVAHKTCLEKNGKTIAILGAGIQEVARNTYSKKTMTEILSNGNLLVSEYHPLTKATKFTFPARNRIISGLSLGTLVIEAAQKSGALITAHYALEEGREVFALPGSIFSEKSVGTHNLIKQGAQLITSAQDILENLDLTVIKTINSEMEPKFNDDLEKKIYSKLSFEPLHIDKISKICGLSPQEIAVKLSILELSGIIKNVGGGMFIKR